jgi:glycosyltransferase involved in cell wall biosynthesis
LGVASAIKPRKRLEDFVQLVGQLRQQGLRVLGLIAGGGRFTDLDYERRLKELICQAGLQAHCRMIGNLDPITPFFKAIDISVNTSEMEILSMSLCEAMACGKPTVAYGVGGNPETLPDNWCVVPFGDVRTLTEKVAKLVVDEEFRRMMGVAAERHVRATFDAPVLAARQAAIYEEILGRRLAPAAEKAHCPAHCV